MALYPPCPVTGISGSCRSRPDETGGVPACRPLAGCWAPLHFQASSENRGGDGVPRWRNGAILSSQPDRSAAGRSESATIASRSRVGRLTNRLREARTRQGLAYPLGGRLTALASLLADEEHGVNAQNAKEEPEPEPRAAQEHPVRAAPTASVALRLRAVLRAPPPPRIAAGPRARRRRRRRRGAS